jgi:U3 small nucleolar RNA-associated protein 10
MFGQCLQTMKFQDPNDKWYWLKDCPKSGVPLSKNSIFQHGSQNPRFLEYIGNFTYDAVKEMDSKTGTLQILFVFYCTSLIGALELTKNIQESHIVHVLRTLFKGFKSPVIDFTAACYMIAAQLVVRAQLSRKLTSELIEKVPNLIHPGLSINGIMLLALIYETQSEEPDITDKAMEKILGCKWIPAALGEIKRGGSPVTKFYKSLISNSLKKIQQETDRGAGYKNLCQNLVNEVLLSEREALIVIK